jgi:hypothetical protein
MPQTFIETENKRLIKKFHTLLSKQSNPGEFKSSMLISFGVTSIKDLTNGQLIEACNALDLVLNPELQELDKLRKQLMASIGAWLRAMGRVGNKQLIKAIACRSAKTEDFNKISKEKLRSLYSAFNKKKKDLETVEKLTKDEIDYLSLLN